MIKRIFDFIVKNELNDQIKEIAKYILIGLGAVKLLLLPYIPMQLQGMSSGLLVAVATIFGHRKWGLWATGWSLLVVIIGYFINYSFNLYYFFLGSAMLLTISLLLGSLLEYTTDLIKKLYSTQQNLEQQKDELNFLYNQLNDKIEKARELHQQFLPDQFPERDNITFGSYYQPSDNIGGDFYNTIELENHIIFFVSDVRGHGLDGALTNIFIRENINNFLLNQNKGEQILSPQEIMNYVVDKYQEENFPDDHFICLLLGVIDLKANKIIISNAGFQIPPLIVSQQKELTELTEGGMPISSLTFNNLAFELDSFAYGESTVQLKPGTTILITTDGLIEENINGEQYGLSRVKRKIVNKFCLPPEILVNDIINDFKKFIHNLQPQDDITLLAIKRKLDPIAEWETEINSSYQEVKQTQKKIIQFISSYLDLEKRFELAIGAQELMLNSLEHGNQKNEAKKIRVTVEVTAEYIKLNVIDEGIGFNWKKYINQELELTVADEQEFNTERERGIKLANTACDYLWYNEKGNQAYLLKLRDREVDNHA